MSNNWYIVDVSGETQGPMDETQLIILYMNEMIHSKTYVWNGHSVSEWLPIKDVAFIYDKIKNHYINNYDEIHGPEPVSPTPSPKKASPKRISPQTMTNDDMQTKLERLLIEQELDAVIPSILESANSPVDKSEIELVISSQMMIPNDEALESNEAEPANDENMQSRHINIPHYPSTLAYLSRDAERTELMANIRNGISLRDQEISTMKQSIYKQPPKRLKDSFEANQSKAQFPSDFMRQNVVKQSRESVMATDLSLETHIDHNLILDVQRNGLHKKNLQKSSPDSSLYHHRHTGPAPFCNEVAQRANLIRKRFGEVKLC